jgi:2-polyprenyl-3-methyl-5-hydroxy-6-metoxy-1,4-benzoquinol methylase
MQNANCQICDLRLEPAVSPERATVRCNVRHFRDEQFDVWRCPQCRSIHACQDVDLGYYYARYPRFSQDIEWRLHPSYRTFMRRLTRHGLERGHDILDYGCGSGSFVRFLQQEGFSSVRGYDAYAEEFRDDSLLAQRYDCIVSQDVIEHVDDPIALLARFDQLAKPGALICIGTPDAAAIDLTDPEEHVHALHAPYHRHIFAADALRAAAERFGWSLVRYLPRMYSATRVPTQNPRFGRHYLRCHDDCVDSLTEPARFDSWRLWTPATLFYALFGYWLDRHTDVMFIFRAPA